MKKKGFTLVELLVVIVILSLLSTIAVFSYISFINKSREKAYNQMIGTLKTATRNHIMKDDPKFENNLYEIQASKLIDMKYLDKLVDPKTKKQCDLKHTFVKVRRRNKISNNSINKSISGINQENIYDICLVCGNNYRGYCKDGLYPIVSASEIDFDNNYELTSLDESDQSTLFLYDKNSNILFNYELKNGPSLKMFGLKTSLVGDNCDYYFDFLSKENNNSSTLKVNTSNIYSYKSGTCSIKFDINSDLIADKEIKLGISDVVSLEDEKYDNKIIELNGKVSTYADSFYESKIEVVGNHGVATYKDLECLVLGTNYDSIRCDVIEKDNTITKKVKIYSVEPKNSETPTTVLLRSKSNKHAHIVYKVKAHEIKKVDYIIRINSVKDNYRGKKSGDYLCVNTNTKVDYTITPSNYDPSNVRVDKKYNDLKNELTITVSYADAKAEVVKFAHDKDDVIPNSSKPVCKKSVLVDSCGGQKKSCAIWGLDFDYYCKE